MSIKSEFQASLAICAAIIGAGFASGREIVSFFSGLGSASFAGVAVACSAVGALTYVIIRLSQQTHQSGFAELYGALMGSACRDAMYILYSLLCLVASAAMLSAGAHLGELLFDSGASRLIGRMLTFFCGILAVFCGMKVLSALGGILVPLIGLYYFVMLIKGNQPSEFAPEMLPVSLPMGLLYAAFNTALSGGTICLTARSGISPKCTAILTGGILFILLCCANAALLRSGDGVLMSALPTVVLSAQLGLFGYHMSIIVMWLSVLTTLCALLHSLREQLLSRLSPIAALMLPALGALALSLCGFEALVDTGYPLLGWICCCALLALLLFLPERRADITLLSDTASR